MNQDYEWEWFESYVTGVIEAVFVHQKKALDSYKASAAMAAGIIRRDAQRRFLIKLEAEG